MKEKVRDAIGRAAMAGGVSEDEGAHRIFNCGVVFVMVLLLIILVLALASTPPCV